MNRKLLKLTAFLLILLVALASSCQPEEPKEIEYTILPASLNFEATGGEDGFTVSVKSPAIVESIESLSAWCQVSTNGVSPVNVMVTVDPYTYYEARNTTVVVNMKLGENKTSATVQITQAGVEIPEWVLIDGIKWATRNVDMPGTFAAKPEDAGMFYQWGKNIGWSATDPMINSDGETAWDNPWDQSIWDKDNNPCPPGWRLPTLEEQQSLIAADHKLTTLNGVNGFYFGSGVHKVFFPVVGYRVGGDGTLMFVGSAVRYWSGTLRPNISEYAYSMLLRERASISSGLRSFCYPVRCVSE